MFLWRKGSLWGMNMLRMSQRWSRSFAVRLRLCLITLVRTLGSNGWIHSTWCLKLRRCLHFT
jgi:hypothetical protein